MGFVSRMIEESLILREQIHLYTSLLGRKRSLRVILRKLRELQIPSVGSTVLYQGKTCRWCVCWSFDHRFQEVFDANPLRYKVFGRKKLLHQRHDVVFEVDGIEEEEEIWRRVDDFCQACEGVEMMGEDEEEAENAIVHIHQFIYHFPDGTETNSNKMNRELEKNATQKMEKSEEVTFSINVEEEEEGNKCKCIVSFHILVGVDES